MYSKSNFSIVNYDFLLFLRLTKKEEEEKKLLVNILKQ